jgi:hypothetical protein
LLNKEVTIETVVEYLDSCDSVEPGWSRKRKANGWTLGTLNQSDIDVKKFEYIKALYPHRWKDYRSYEITSTTYSKAKDTTIQVGPDSGKNLWEVMKHTFKTEIDLSDKLCENQNDVIKIVYEIVRRFRLDYPHHVADLITVYLPRLESSVFGKCSLADVPNPANPSFKAEQLDDLLLKMKGSAIIRNAADDASKDQSLIKKIWMKNRSVVKKDAQKQAAEEAKSSPNKPVIKVKSKVGVKAKGKKQEDAPGHSDTIVPVDSVKQKVGDADLSVADLELTEDMAFIQNIDYAMQYLLTISEVVAVDLVKPFTQITLALSTLSIGQGFPVRVNSVAKVVKGWSLLFKILRLEIYRRAALQPRPSDIDFTGQTIEDATQATANLIDSSTEPNAAQVVIPQVETLNAEDLLEKLNGSMSKEYSDLKSLLSQQDINQPFQCQMVAANTLCQIMMLLPDQIIHRGGTIDSHKGAFFMLTELVASKIDVVLPNEMVDFVKLIDRVQKDGLVDRLDVDFFGRVQSAHLKYEKFIAYRVKLFAYLMSTLGQQSFPLTSGPSKVPTQYLTQFARNLFDEIIAKVDTENLFTDIDGCINSKSFTELALKFAEPFWFVIENSGLLV